VLIKSVAARSENDIFKSQSGSDEPGQAAVKLLYKKGEYEIDAASGKVNGKANARVVGQLP
jgi:hypothetical protein